MSWRACKFFFVLGKFYPATAWSFVKEDRELFWQGCKGHLLFSLRLHDHSKWEEELRIFFEQDNIDQIEQYLGSLLSIGIKILTKFNGK